MSRRRVRALGAACSLALGVPAAALGAGHVGWAKHVVAAKAAAQVGPQGHDSMDEMMGGSMGQMMGAGCDSMMVMNGQACRSITARRCQSMMEGGAAMSEQCQTMMSAAGCASMMGNPRA